MDWNTFKGWVLDRLQKEPHPTQLTVEEADGSPSVLNVRKLVVDNDSLTYNGDHSVTLTLGGAGGGMEQHSNEYHDPDMSFATHDHAGVYDPAGTGDTEVAAHVAETDPHTGYIAKSIITAKGDQIVGLGAGVPTRVGVGAEDTVWTVDNAGFLKWAKPKFVTYLVFGTEDATFGV